MNNLSITPLQYTNKLIEHYESLVDLPGFTLLESSDKQRGRYDIITAFPYDELKLTRDDANIQDAFKLLENKLQPQTTSSTFPFQGGAIGYIAYDLATQLAGIPIHPHPANDMPLLDVKFYDWAIITDHRLRQIHIVANNHKPETRDIVVEIAKRFNTRIQYPPSFCLKDGFQPLIHKSEYLQAFNAIHRDLMRGRAYQVNYTQPFLGQFTGNPWELYKRVRQANPVPYGAFLSCEGGKILSFSPEKFLSIDQGLVITSPIKGTIKRSHDKEEDAALANLLLASEKNRAENIMIVDLLRNDLGKFAKPGSVQVSALCELQSFNTVHHLVSHIQALCDTGVTPLAAFQACFPGGSITGAPKLEAMHIIGEQEPLSRGIYCGNIFYLSTHGRLDSNITIRTMVAKSDSLYLSAGGGIVIDSNAEDEYAECFAKIAGIIRTC